MKPVSQTDAIMRNDRPQIDLVDALRAHADNENRHYVQQHWTGCEAVHPLCACARAAEQIEILRAELAAAQRAIEIVQVEKAQRDVVIQNHRENLIRLERERDEARDLLWDVEWVVADYGTKAQIARLGAALADSRRAEDK